MSFRDCLLGIAKYIDQRTGLDIITNEVEQHPWALEAMGPFEGPLFRALVATATRMGHEDLFLRLPLAPGMSLGEMATVITQTACQESDPAKFPAAAHWRSCEQHREILRDTFSIFAVYAGMAAGMLPTDTPPVPLFTCGDTAERVGPIAGSRAAQPMLFFYERQLKELLAGTSGFSEGQIATFVERCYAYDVATGQHPRGKDLAAIKAKVAKDRKPV